MMEEYRLKMEILLHRKDPDPNNANEPMGLWNAHIDQQKVRVSRKYEFEHDYSKKQLQKYINNGMKKGTTKKTVHQIVEWALDMRNTVNQNEKKRLSALQSF